MKSKASALLEAPPLAPPALVAHCRPVFAQLQSQTPLGRGLVLGVSSAGRGTGRTTVALGLAAAGAEQIGDEARILLVDCDIEHPALAERCGVAIGADLTQVLLGQAPVAQALAPLMPGVALLGLAAPPPNPARFLRRLEESGLLLTLGHYFDAVIVDLPPLQSPALGSLPPQLVPQLCLVARAAQTSRGDLQQMLRGLPPGLVAAVILNGQKARLPRLIDRVLD